jgi:hypothetical protein
MSGYKSGLAPLSRFLLNAATALSLVLCVAAVALWVRSYWRTAYVSGEFGDRSSMHAFIGEVSGGAMLLHWHQKGSPSVIHPFRWSLSHRPRSS